LGIGAVASTKLENESKSGWATSRQVKIGLGELWACDKGAKGRLGLNDGQRRLVPTRVDPQQFAHAPSQGAKALHLRSAFRQLR